MAFRIKRENSSGRTSQVGKAGLPPLFAGKPGIMRIVFMGTPESAVPSLQRLLADGHEILSVWTQPDKPAGRGDRLHSSAIKDFALAHKLPVVQPNKIKTGEVKALFASYKADLAVVV